MIDVVESLAAVGRREHVTTYRGVEMLKFEDDLRRYEVLIEQTRPEVIIETGSHRGASARWFADRPGVALVVSIDLSDEPPLPPKLSDRIMWVTGTSSTDRAMFDLVFGGWGGGIKRRTMVVLDSDHSARHVAREISLYGPLVTPGCALVVEDGLFDYATIEQLDAEGMPGLALGGPRAAIADQLACRPEWEPASFESISSKISQNVDGWWIKR